MAPNLIGNTFLLAETAIANDNANNDNNNSDNSNTKVNSGTSNIDQTIIKATCSAVISATETVNNNNDISQMEPVAAAIIEKTTTTNLQTQTTTEEVKPYRLEIVWFNVLLFVILHSTAFYGIWLVFARSAYIELFVCVTISGLLGGLGVTAGVHRLWSHRAYKAKLPLRIFLMLCQSMAFQNSIYEWSRDHRVHHKFTDTNADPHNSKRGFFFAHMGWLMCKKHNDVKEKGKLVDMSDLNNDPVVVFQKKYYFVIMPICCFILPALFPYFLLGSSLEVCFFLCSMTRYALSLHGTWLVNSAAHFYGMKPYDVNVSAVDSKLVASLAFGEGWHNYHHVFPWDYKAAELGTYKHNWSTAFINLMAKIGQAYDLKSVSKELILKRVRRTGDGSHPSVMSTLVDSKKIDESTEITDEMVAQLDHDKEPVAVWGWDDKDICKSDRMSARIESKKEQ